MIRVEQILKGMVPECMGHKDTNKIAEKKLSHLSMRLDNETSSSQPKFHRETALRKHAYSNT